MKTWKKKCLCKKACKIAIISFEMADKFLARYYISTFFDNWSKYTLIREIKNGLR